MAAWGDFAAIVVVFSLCAFLPCLALDSERIFSDPDVKILLADAWELSPNEYFGLALDNVDPGQLHIRQAQSLAAPGSHPASTHEVTELWAHFLERTQCLHGLCMTSFGFVHGFGHDGLLQFQPQELPEWESPVFPVGF